MASTSNTDNGQRQLRNDDEKNDEDNEEVDDDDDKEDKDAVNISVRTYSQVCICLWCDHPSSGLFSSHRKALPQACSRVTEAHQSVKSTRSARRVQQRRAGRAGMAPKRPSGAQRAAKVAHRTVGEGLPVVCASVLARGTGSTSDHGGARAALVELDSETVFVLLRETRSFRA